MSPRPGVAKAKGCWGCSPCLVRGYGVTITHSLSYADHYSWYIYWWSPSEGLLIIIITYLQVEREQAWCWSQSDGSLYNHPRRLLFHLSVFRFSYFSLCICISTQFYPVVKLIHILILIIISTITNNSAVSKFAVFVSKYIFSWFNERQLWTLGAQKFLIRFCSYGLQNSSNWIGPW